MVKLKLIPYKLKVKNLDKSKKNNPVYEKLDSADFRKLFQEFIKDHEALKIDTAKERIFNCESCRHNPTDDIFYGIMGYGDYGYSSELVNVKTLNKRDKGMDEAEKIKFYYLVKIEDEEAYVLLNQFRHRGIKTQFMKQLNIYINGKNVYTNKVQVQMNHLVSTKILRIKDLGKIRLIRKREKKDIEGQILDRINKEDKSEYIEEKIIKPKTGAFQSFKIVINKLRKNFKEKEYVEIDKIKYDRVKLDVEMEDGSSKTIVLDNDVRYNESIEQEFIGDFPNLEDFYKKTKGYIERITK